MFSKKRVITFDHLLTVEGVWNPNNVSSLVISIYALQVVSEKISYGISCVTLWMIRIGRLF